MGAMKVWDGTTWQTVAPFSERASCFVGPDAPTGTAYAGDLWWDTDDPTIAYPGAELSYTERTTNVSITATTEAAAQEVITSGARTYDGSPIKIEFFTSRIDMPATAGGQFIMQLWDGATNLGWFCQWIFAGQGYLVPVNVQRRIVPTVGTHTYRVCATVYNGTGQVCGGTGGVGGFQPAFLRITRV